MTFIKTYPYSEQGIAEIENWKYGKNWPVVYIIYNQKEVYIGETLDAVKRTRQHLPEKSLQGLEKITFITEKTYNKFECPNCFLVSVLTIKTRRSSMAGAIF